MINFLKTILSKVRNLWFRRSNESFVRYLKNKGVTIGDGVNFRSPESTVIDLTRPCLVTIGNHVDINHNFTILTHDFGTFVFRNLYKDFVASSGKVSIGNNIVFGRNVTILKGVNIGDNCIIGTGSVITKSIPSNSVAVGVPCRVVSSIDDYYRKRLDSQIEEAIMYGCELKNKYGSLSPKMFTEEWNLFYRYQDIGSEKELENEILWRLNGIELSDYLKNKIPYFDGFEEFEKEINNRLK